MDNFDALSIAAELALGIAGFSGVVVALGTRPGSWPEVDRLRLASLLALALGALFFILFAMMLSLLGVAEDRVWRISSFLMTVYGAIFMSLIVPRAWQITRRTTGFKSPYSVSVFIPAIIVFAVNILVQLLSGVGMFSGHRFGIFFAGLVVLLIISAIQFARLLFVRRNSEES